MRSYSEGRLPRILEEIVAGEVAGG
jgi:hypothetical protein